MDVYPTSLVVDLGSNDLDSLHYPDPHELAISVFGFDRFTFQVTLQVSGRCPGLSQNFPMPS